MAQFRVGAHLVQFIENLLSRRMSQNPPQVSTRSFFFPFPFFMFYCFGFSFSAISGAARCDTPPDRETKRGGGQRRTGSEQVRASNQRAGPSVLTLGANQRSAKNKDRAVSCWAQCVRLVEDFHLWLDWQAKLLSKTDKTFNKNTTRYIEMTENLESP